jgi:hypothetical protein
MIVCEITPVDVQAAMQFTLPQVHWRDSGSTLYERASLASLLFFICTFLLAGCHFQRRGPDAAVQFTRVPPATTGGPDVLDIIEGRVTAGNPQLQLVLYAKSGKWWIQPAVSEPFTAIRPDSTWTNSTHLGSDYAALLVQTGFHPATALDQLPAPGGQVISVAAVRGSEPSLHISKTLQFSGYEWRVRDAPSSRGGKNNYDSKNAFTDSTGALHLRIAKVSNDWTCAEVALTRSLGYGTYSFVVRDVSHLGPAAVFTIFTWDYSGANKNSGEMDIEVSRWGDPTTRNGEYVIQPFYVPENTFRFALPADVLTQSFRWEPGRVSFRTLRGADPASKTAPLVEHVFASGVPPHVAESVRMNLYVFRSAKEALSNETEVVVDKFEYLP